MCRSFSSIVACLLFILYSFFLSSCEKEYSYEGGFLNGSTAGTAVYTLVGAGGDCSNPVISGQYNEGVPLTSGNTIQLSVKVDSIGTYAVTTNLADGFSFSASGNFTTTGIQKITLVGNGTPTSVGNFAFIPPVGLGCNFNVQVTKALPAVAKFTFTGEPGNCSNSKITGDYTAGFTLTSANTLIVNVNVVAIGAYSITTDTLDGVSFNLSGAFTATGDQSVTLIGSGTPDFARNLTFSLISPGIPGCVFNLTITDPAPLATYVLESGAVNNTSQCIYTIQGTVTHATPVNSSNTVTMRVFVSVPGNFTICTNSVNGVVFSYSGTFTTMGAQYVVLTGVGTPVTAGTYTFVPNIVGPHPIGGQACSFDIEVL